jgi:CheY-like chemotaxis protein
VRLLAELDPAAGKVRVDRAEIERVVLNLCLNARDAMPAGGEVLVRVRRAGDAQVELAVLDQGIGLTPEVRARMFDPFFSTKGTLGGAGLGLSSVHGVVAQSGGELLVRDRSGPGTEMRVLLPRVTEPGSEPVPGQEPEASEEPLDLGQAGGLHVLVVDDQEEVLGAVGGLLRGLGHRVRTAGSGAEALELLAAERPDLLLTDVSMPGMDGLELGRAVGERFPGVPVLYMSGYHQDGVEQLSGSFLAKPFGVRELAAALARALGERPRPQRGLGLARRGG